MNEAIPLIPVNHQRTAEMAMEIIGDYIIKNLKVGDVLPSERRLSEQLQISRNITREALQHYRTLGIIDSKPKVGAVISRLLPENPYAGYMPFILASEHTFDELYHLRLILETGNAKEAVKKATPKDIATLTELCRKIETSSGPMIRQYDVEFHSLLLKISGNRLINSLIPLVVKFFSEYFQKKIRNPHPEGHQDHWKMVEALKKRDAEMLADLLRRHLSVYAGLEEAKSE